MKVRLQDSSILTVEMRRQNMEARRRFSEMEGWLFEGGLLLQATLGMGKLLFLPSSAAVHRAVVRELENDPTFLLESAGQAGER